MVHKNSAETSDFQTPMMSLSTSQSDWLPPHIFWPDIYIKIMRLKDTHNSPGTKQAIKNKKPMK